MIKKENLRVKTKPVVSGGSNKLDWPIVHPLFGPVERLSVQRMQFQQHLSNIIK